MPAQLLALNEGANIPIDKPILLLGRDMECDIRLDSRKISRRHCCIARLGDQLIVRDLGSTNGVRINGVRVVEGRLKAGDELTIGNFRYQITFDDRPVPLAGTDRPPSVEAMLESCEEPVRLKDPGAGKAPAKQGAKVESPLAAKPAPPPPKAPKETPLDPPRGHSPTQVLPDELDLAPPSDDLKDMPKPPPPKVAPGTAEAPPDMEV